jgi:hypothetical protein
MTTTAELVQDAKVSFSSLSVATTSAASQSRLFARMTNGLSRLQTMRVVPIVSERVLRSLKHGMPEKIKCSLALDRK